MRLVERLVADGLITPEQQELALAHVQRTGERVEEALLDVNALDEAALLKYLANHYKTRFVSTEKLAKADIDQLTLDKVPRKLAERDLVFPVLFDPNTGSLSVVTPDPDNAPALHDIQLACGAREVRAFVARPRAVKAAINKAYHGDIHAFAVLDRSAHQTLTDMMDIYERNYVGAESMAVSLATENEPRERTLSAEEFKKSAQVTTSAFTGKGVSTESYLETLNVLVTLLEHARQDLRGHSSQVARLMKKSAERIGLSEVQTAAFMIAAYFHDLGKMGKYHLTLLNVSEYEGHRIAAEKLQKAPQRIMEAVQLPREATASVEAMYECFDGKGFPEGLSGKDIPLGARLLSIADTYADLTQNPRNPFRKTLNAFQACEVLARFKGTIFDPNLVDLFRLTVSGDDLKARLLADRHRALIIDSDPEETTVLELRMLEQGFEVLQARTSDQALKLLERGDVEIVVSELNLEPNDGLSLLAAVRKQPWGMKLPWVVLTGTVGRTEAQRAFELGAADFVNKPVSADVLVAKLKQILEREAASGAAGRGVSGSLQEMGITEIVQVLWHGRKTGSLKIRSGTDAGEIHFVDGNIYNALWGNQRGDEAIYTMLGLTQGEFVLDPNFKAPQQVIQETPEALLLEGMRRLDESAPRLSR